MLRLLIRILVMAFVFYFVLPLIGGISFNGTFMHAMGAGVLFGIMSWFLELIAIAVSTMLAISTWGLALLVLVPLWVIGYWLFPAFVLKVVADMMPSILTVHGWGPAILGGLVILLVGLLTGGHPKRYRDRTWARA
jgi:uncharacterized membrane protein YvlD (DUF360 family)